MHKIIITFALVLLFSTLSSAQVYFGGGLRYNSNSDFSAIAPQVKLGVGLSDKVVINGNFAYYLGSKATWTTDLDLHYKLFNIADRFHIDPMAGITFTRTDITNNSLTLGLSLKLLTDSYTYFLEPRYILDNNQTVFTLGVIF